MAQVQNRFKNLLRLVTTEGDPGAREELVDQFLVGQRFFGAAPSGERLVTPHCTVTQVDSQPRPAGLKLVRLIAPLVRHDVFHPSQHGLQIVT